MPRRAGPANARVARRGCFSSTHSLGAGFLGYNRGMSKKHRTGRSATSADPHLAEPIKIIGGQLRGRKIAFLGDDRTRPMKHRVRESLFNLISTDSVGRYAVDLFAGTGALAFEAISRGAVGATLLERHFPTADAIARSAAELGLGDRVRVVPGDTFLWARRHGLPREWPWLIFASPPYEFWIGRRGEMLELLERLLADAPAGSVLAAESDERFAMSDLPRAAEWDVREYPPARIGILRLATA